MSIEMFTKKMLAAAVIMKGVHWFNQPDRRMIEGDAVSRGLEQAAEGLTLIFTQQNMKLVFQKGNTLYNNDSRTKLKARSPAFFLKLREANRI